jgi:pimeloyl-ACP methyl ester carboxylesterase
MLAVLDALREFDGTDALRRVEAPTLVVAGSRDRAGTEAGRRLAAEVPGARLHVVAGAGASLNTQSARELAELTHEFLDTP